jgi:hypothetical protein
MDCGSRRKNRVLRTRSLSYQIQSGKREARMATAETESNNQEGITRDHESDIGTGKGPVTAREKLLFGMSRVRTICAVIAACCGLVGALAQAIVLWRVFHMGH